MCPAKHELAWPRPATSIDAAPAERSSGAAAGKNRSPEASLAPEGTAQGPNDGEVQTRLIRQESEFAQLAPRWLALLLRTPEANVFVSHEWLYAWWLAYRPDAELAIVLIERDEELLGIAPMMMERRTVGGVGRRVLRFIGDGTTETDHIGLVVAPTSAEATLRALLDAIDGLPWDIAEFNQMPEASPTTRAMLLWLTERKWSHAVTVVACPVRQLPATYDALLATLPGRLRTSVRSSRKKLQQAHSLEFGLHQRTEELSGALTTFFANHASRWQGKGQPGVFADARKRDFYGRLTPQLLERGWLRFFYLKLDGRVVAQQYCFAVDGTVMLLQEGFDFSLAQDNVGNTLRGLVFEHLIASGATCYDFLAGTSRHKQSWSDGTVNDLRVRCARRSWRGWLFFRLPQHWEQAKEVLRPWRDRLSALRPGPASNAP